MKTLPGFWALLVAKAITSQRTWGALALESTLLTWRAFVVISPLPVSEAGTKRMLKYIYICKIQETTISCNKLTGQQGKTLKEHTSPLTNHKSQSGIVPDIYLISLFSDSLFTFQDPVKALPLHPLQHLLSSSSNYPTSFPQFFL